MRGPLYAENKTFNLTAVASAYAPEEVLLCGRSATDRSFPLRNLSILIETLGGATGAVLELWLLKVGGDPTNTAHFFYSGVNVAVINSHVLTTLALWPGAKIRAKSAGTAGALVADIVAMGAEL